MKKWTYVLGGVVLGIALTTSTSAFAAQIQSLVGHKVAGEYTVKVNDALINDKAIIVDGKAHVPLRAISNSLGVDLKVDGKTIDITTTDTHASSTDTAENQYTGKSKESIEESITTLKERILKPRESERESIIKEIEVLKGTGATDSLVVKEAQLKEYDDAIAKTKAELAQAEAALAAIK